MQDHIGDANTMTDLSHRCEQASGPDRELDRERLELIPQDCVV